MNVSSLQKKLSFPVGEVMAALLVAQPLLDVLSYFMGQADATWLTTALRTVLLFAVGVYGFSITENRRAYYAMYGVVGGLLGAAHAQLPAPGLPGPGGGRGGVPQAGAVPLVDPFLCHLLPPAPQPGLPGGGLLAVNVGLILLVIALSYAVGQPVYTYDYPERGVAIGILGWFGVANSQSSILTLLVPPLLLWGLRSQRLWQFCLCCLGGFGLLYFTGTRLTYYGLSSLAAHSWRCCCCGGSSCCSASPWRWRWLPWWPAGGFPPWPSARPSPGDSYAIYQEKADAILGEDAGYTHQPGEEVPPELLEKITRVYTEVYDQPGIYGVTLLSDLIDEFGLEAVMEQYNYATDPQTLYNTRVKKLTAMEMVWQKQDFLTRILGFEYAQCHVGSHIYGPGKRLSGAAVLLRLFGRGPVRGLLPVLCAYLPERLGGGLAGGCCVSSLACPP